MKPVSIMWTQGVDTAEAELAVLAVRDFLRDVYSICSQVGLALPSVTIRPFGTWYIPSIPDGSPYSGTRWYAEASLDAQRLQVIGSRFLELVRDEPWQKSNPHWDVAIIDWDLGDPSSPFMDDRGQPFALGMAIPDLATVVSVHRLRGLVRSDERARALRQLVLHQFGRVIGLPSRSRHEDVKRIGDGRYCAYPCVMQYVRSVGQIARDARPEKDNAGTGLCLQCRRDIIELMVMQKRSPN